MEARSWAEVRANLTGINKGFLAYTKKKRTYQEQQGSERREQLLRAVAQKQMERGRNRP